MSDDKIKKKGKFFVDRLGRTFKTREAAKYLNAGECWMYNSGRSDLYDWHHRYLLMTKGIGYIKMASEIEPYNPDIIWIDGFYSEMTNKSSEYMLDLIKTLMERLKKSKENGYDMSYAEERIKPVFKYGLADYKRKIKSGKIW